MKIPYPRPTRLSDPHSDFAPDTLDALLATPDSKLEWSHFRDLLGPFLPAGTYQESLYFLPLAFQCLESDEYALDLTTSVCWFVSEYTDDLSRDGLLDECRSKLEGCLDGWVAEFEVEHFDRDGCAAKGWQLSYFDYVHRSETVCETLCDLDRFVRQADLVDQFISRLASSDEASGCGWFLELARAQDDAYHPPSRKSIQGLFSDADLLARKRDIVQKHLVPMTTSPTYWNDVFAKLGLESRARVGDA